MVDDGVTWDGKHTGIISIEVALNSPSAAAGSSAGCRWSAVRAGRGIDSSVENELLEVAGQGRGRRNGGRVRDVEIAAVARGELEIGFLFGGRFEETRRDSADPGTGFFILGIGTAVAPPGAPPLLCVCRF